MATLEPSDHHEVSERFWNDWNSEWRFRGGRDAFMQRQLDIAVAEARSAKLHHARILGFGCGTGWLENGLLPFGEVWGTDLSPQAIAEGSKQHPDVKLICCDFLRTELPGPFDFVVSADALVPMEDHALCIRRVGALLRPGGTFLLMTQNPYVWARRSRLQPHPSGIPHATPDQWPTRRRILALLSEQFVVERQFSFDPGGDAGSLWWVENRHVMRLTNWMIGEYRWLKLLELFGLGRELVFVARRR